MPLYDFRCADGHRFDRFVPLAHFGDRQSCECGHEATRLVSAPRILADTIEPCMGADGKMHTSLGSLRASYRPSGNPQGESYTEIGNEKIAAAPKPAIDKAQRREDIKAAMQDVKNGRVPPLTILGD